MSAESMMNYEDMLRMQIDNMIELEEANNQINQTIIAEKEEEISLLHDEINYKDNEIFDLKEKLAQYESALDRYKEVINRERNERSRNQELAIGFAVLIVVGFLGRQFLELEVYKQAFLVVAGVVFFAGRIGISKLVEKYESCKK